MPLIEDGILSAIQGRSGLISFHLTEEEGRAFIVASIKSPADTREAASLSYTQIAEVLSERGMAILHERIFGSLSVERDVMSARTQAFTSFGISPDSPITYVEGNPPWGKGFAGVIIHAVKADAIWTVIDRGVPCGCGWKLNGETHLVLQNIQAFNSKPSDHTSKAHQARLMLENSERILRENGASYRDVVRTWFYLSDILGWYAAFNKVRNKKYGEFGIMPGSGNRELLLPASTGIEGNFSTGAACAMDLIAVIGNNEDGRNTHLNTHLTISSRQGRDNDHPSPVVGEGKGEGEHLITTRPSIKRLTNPSQVDAFRYGSAFARGSVIKNGSTDIIEVSGTAAIDEHGVSLYPGDIRAQIDSTFHKVQHLLAQEDAGLENICAATVFVKKQEFAEIVYEMAAARGLEDFPCVCIVADVCREELLFEIDAEAVVKTGARDEKEGSRI